MTGAEGTTLVFDFVCPSVCMSACTVAVANIQKKSYVRSRSKLKDANAYTPDVAESMNKDTTEGTSRKLLLKNSFSLFR